jgi:hypothetical protein
MVNSYIVNDVDLIISRYIEIEKKENFELFKKKYRNNRNTFFEKMNSTSSHIEQNINISHPWNKLFNETLFLLYELYNIYIKQEKIKVPAMLLIYILKLSNSMRILFNSGFLEPGLIIYRTIIENIQLELISINDINFAKMLLNENEDANTFWHKNISKGKLSKKLKDIIRDIDINIELLIPNEDELKRLSECVHASVGTPLMMLEPLIISPNLGSIEPFGTINYHFTETYIRIIQNYLEYFSANIKLIFKEKTWFEKNKTWNDDIENILINYNAVSKCFYEYYFPQYENNKKLWNMEKYFDED